MSEEQHDSTSRGYETRDARPGPLLGFLVVLAVGLALTMLVAGWVARSFEEGPASHDRAHPMRDFRTPVPGPRLQARPDLELEEYRRVEEQQAGSYAWIDPVEGIVRIPLERARELVLREGLPSRGAAGEEER